MLILGHLVNIRLQACGCSTVVHAPKAKQAPSSCGSVQIFSIGYQPTRRLRHRTKDGAWRRLAAPARVIPGLSALGFRYAVGQASIERVP